MQIGPKFIMFLIFFLDNALNKKIKRNYRIFFINSIYRCSDVAIQLSLNNHIRRMAEFRSI